MSAVASCNRQQQWIECFERELATLRPHLTHSILQIMSDARWHEYGAAGEDPIKAAKSLSAQLDKPAQS